MLNDKSQLMFITIPNWSVNILLICLLKNKVIIELKAAETLCENHELQLINYLKATDIEVGLLLNFGKKNRRKI